jgi:hypothetical protein
VRVILTKKRGLFISKNLVSRLLPCTCHSALGLSTLTRMSQSHASNAARRLCITENTIESDYSATVERFNKAMAGAQGRSTLHHRIRRLHQLTPDPGPRV